ncbi:MAG TPA: hypothetical protein VMG99_08835 [Thermoplasmata archaeon]|nr:hypothetical protein [Thermoplasmata archaeon]
MTSYRARDVMRASGLPMTTAWRRLVRLEVEGRIRRVVRPGGHGGTFSAVEFAGSLPELTEAVVGAARRPTPFASLLPRPPRAGPPCPRCGVPTDLRSQRTAWCAPCGWGYLVSAETARQLPA